MFEAVQSCPRGLIETALGGDGVAGCSGTDCDQGQLVSN